MRDLFRLILLLGIVLAIPIVPFVLFGADFEGTVRSWFAESSSKWTVAFLAICLLATDVILPVPSSLISTIGGWKLGWFAGTSVSWLGMSLGAVLGFAAARKCGHKVASRLSKPNQLQHYAVLADRFGPLSVILCRGVPVLAEASVLWMGMHGLKWRRFLVPVLLTNLVLAFTYSTFGEIAAAHEWLPAALGVSVALPILFLAAFSRIR